MLNNIEIICNHQNKTVAIIVYRNYEYRNVNFITPNDFALQLGLMHRPKNDIVPAHIHKQQKRLTTGTQEVLIVVEGEMKISLYEESGIEICHKILVKGDLIVLAYGGHKIEMLTDVKLIEVKQGPYDSKEDKLYI